MDLKDIATVATAVWGAVLGTLGFGISAANWYRDKIRERTFIKIDVFESVQQRARLYEPMLVVQCINRGYKTVYMTGAYIEFEGEPISKNASEIGVLGDTPISPGQRVQQNFHEDYLMQYFNQHRSKIQRCNVVGVVGLSNGETIRSDPTRIKLLGMRSDANVKNEAIRQAHAAMNL